MGCAFVDYKKAFDTVWRSALWHKLVQSGITDKLYNVIVNMYKGIKSCISHDGNISDYFVSFNGVRQGENLSPFLFALFINDIELFLLDVILLRSQGMTCRYPKIINYNVC